MKEWAVIQYKTLTDSRKYSGLLKEAVDFVSASETEIGLRL
jgi:hypothetical protein